MQNYRKVSKILFNKESIMCIQKRFIKTLQLIFILYLLFFLISCSLNKEVYMGNENENIETSKGTAKVIKAGVKTTGGVINNIAGLGAKVITGTEKNFLNTVQNTTLSTIVLMNVDLQTCPWNPACHEFILREIFCPRCPIPYISILDKISVEVKDIAIEMIKDKLSLAVEISR